MNKLESGYSAEIDLIGKSEWHGLLKEFDDATFYQTWSFGEIQWEVRNVSHVVLRHEGRVVSMAQLRLLKFPILRSGAAYLNWGPLWKRRGAPEDRAHLKNMLRALFNNYVGKRGYALRILPKIYDTPENGPLKSAFTEEKFTHGLDNQKTFVVDLRLSLDEIRQNLPRSWRNSLKFAEKQGLHIYEAKELKHYELVAAISTQMKARKSYFGSDSDEILKVDADLPRDLRLKILLCDSLENTVAALGWSNVGRVCFPLVGGTGDQALKHRASFLLWWEMIKDCKARGFEFCDTAGVHEKRNPGGYFFKKGLAGKNAKETTYLGQFDAYRSYPAFVLFKTAMSAREKLINGARRAKAWLK